MSEIEGVDFDKIKDLVTIITAERQFIVSATVTLTTDNVDADHIDSEDAPESFNKTWEYTLYTDTDGLVLRGEWADEEKHPDFAWVPYKNPRSADTNGSENPYLRYKSIINNFGKEIEK